jgi:hypothetical protein
MAVQAVLDGIEAEMGSSGKDVGASEVVPTNETTIVEDTKVAASA